MAVTVARFNLVDPAATPETLPGPLPRRPGDGRLRRRTRHRHHPDRGAPRRRERLAARRRFVFAGAVLGATRRIAVTVSAIIGPLYDPLRLAEDIAVLDLASGGWSRSRRHRLPARGVRGARRGLGRRGKLQDEAAGDAADGVDGRAVHVPRAVRSGSPRARTPSRIRCCWSAAPREGGGPPRGPARAAVLPERASAGAGGVLPRAARRSTAPRAGRMMPAERTPLLHLAEDPDRAWAELRRALPARGADVRLLAVRGHPLGGALAADHGRRAARRGRLPDRHAGRVRGARAGRPRVWYCIRCAAACRSTRAGAACSCCANRYCPGSRGEPGQCPW